jgi:hypothetical protein
MMGVCQGRTLKEDEVYLVLGCSKPVVLRRSDEGNRFTLVGQCYVHGIMDGEWIDNLGRKVWTERKDMNSFHKFWSCWTQPSQIQEWTEELALV